MDTEEINKELWKALIQHLEEFGDDSLGMAKDEKNKTCRKKKRKKRKRTELEENGAEMFDVPVKEKKSKKQDEGDKDASRHAGLLPGAEAKETSHRQPMVIEFIEPGKRAKLSGQPAGAKHKKRRKTMNRKVNEKRVPDQDAEDFREIAREVREFGVTGFSRKEQKKYAQQKAQALGAKAPKSQKMPYPILMYAKQVRQQREQEQRELDKAMGMFTKKKREKAKKDSISTRSHGHWVDGSANGLEATLGRYKAGVQHISRADLKKVKSSKRINHHNRT